MKKLSAVLCLIVVSFGMSGTAKSELFDRGGGLIYCDILDITLLKDAHANGAWINMDWHDAMAWAENLQYYDSVRDVIWDDWRLPDPRNQNGTGPNLGYSFTGSEMGHIYYTELGNTALVGGFTNSGPFENIQTVLTYWMNMEYDPLPGYAYRFDFSSGRMSYGNEGNEFYVWAVRDGDVGAPPVANAGPDIIIINEITLDGSLSYDMNGTIVQYEWHLQHRDDSSYERTGEGVNPTFSDLVYGFYDVVLTVTDSDGLTHTDAMIIAAIGRKGDFDNDDDLDAEDLSRFSQEFGR